MAFGESERRGRGGEKKEKREKKKKKKKYQVFLDASPKPNTQTTYQKHHHKNVHRRFQNQIWEKEELCNNIR